MLRLLRVMAVLSGICLVAIYGTLTTSDRDKPMPIALLDVNNGVERTLYSYVPSDNSPRLITSHLQDTKFHGVSPDGLWVYVYAVPHFERGWPIVGLYRVRLDGEKYQLLAAGNISYAEWSPTREWLLYRDAASGGTARRVDTDSGQQATLPIRFSIPIRLSPDRTRLAYSSWAGSLGGYDIFISEVVSGAEQNITSDLDPSAAVLLWTKGDEWLIIELNSVTDYTRAVYALRPDGSDLQPVISAADYARFQYIVGWMSEERLLVVSFGEYEVSAFRIGQATPVWTITGSPAITPDERTLIYQDVDDGRTLWQMPIDGGTPQKIATLPTMDVGLEISPDSQWALVTTYIDGLSERQLQRVNLVNGATKGIFTQREYAYPDFAWSPDSQWVSAHDGNGNNLWREVLVIMRADGSDLRRLEFSQGRPAISWFEGEPADPLDRMLVGIGVGLIVGALGAGRLWGIKRRSNGD